MSRFFEVEYEPELYELPSWDMPGRKRRTLLPERRAAGSAQKLRKELDGATSGASFHAERS